MHVPALDHEAREIVVYGKIGSYVLITPLLLISNSLIYSSMNDAWSLKQNAHSMIVRDDLTYLGAHVAAPVWGESLLAHSMTFASPRWSWSGTLCGNASILKNKRFMSVSPAVPIVGVPSIPQQHVVTVGHAPLGGGPHQLSEHIARRCS